MLSICGRAVVYGGLLAVALGANAGVAAAQPPAPQPGGCGGLVMAPGNPGMFGMMPIQCAGPPIGATGGGRVGPPVNQGQFGSAVGGS